MGRELVYLMESDLPTYNGQDLLDNLYLFAHITQIAGLHIAHYYLTNGKGASLPDGV